MVLTSIDPSLPKRELAHHLEMQKVYLPKLAKMLTHDGLVLLLNLGNALAYPKPYLSSMTRKGKHARKSNLMGNKSGRMRNIFSKYILDTPVWHWLNHVKTSKNFKYVTDECSRCEIFIY